MLSDSKTFIPNSIIVSVLVFIYSSPHFISFCLEAGVGLCCDSAPHHRLWPPSSEN